MRFRFPTPDARNQRLGALLSLLLIAGVIGFAGSAAFAVGPVTVGIGSSLTPQNLTVAPGTTVTFQSTDGAKHKVRSTSGPTELKSTKDITAGASWSYTFNTLGSYSYLDDVNKDNPALQGTITVSADGSGGGAGGGGGGGAPAPPAPMTASVSLINKSFSPSSVTIAVGGTVTWTNNDGMPHNVTSSSGSFKSANFSSGTYTFTFTTAGTYNYVCTLHGGMSGTIIVQPADGSAPPPAAPHTTPGAGAGGGTGGGAGANPPPPNQPAAPGKPGAHTVTVTDAGFTPATLNARAGDTVTWVNTGQMPHTATAATGEFNLEMMDPGSQVSTVLQKAGTISYVCSFHDFMTASIVVADALPGTVIAPNKPAPAKAKPASSGGKATGSTGGHAPAAAGGGKTQTFQVKVGDNTFTPSSVKARVGDTIVWTNTGRMPHTVTAPDKSFDKQLQPGDTFSYALRAVGTVNYVCSYHPGMAGTLVVGPALAGVAVPPPTAGATGGSSGGAASAAAAVAAAPPAPASSGQTKTYEIKATEMTFTPKMQTARVGDTISWINTGTIPHTVTAADKSFDKTIAPGERFNYVLRKVGDLNYVCTFHPGMAGMLMVKPALAGVTVPPPSAGDEAAAAGGAGHAGHESRFTVEVKDNSFSPGLIEAQVGDTITWVNLGKLTHTVTAKDKSFDKSLKPGEKWSLTLTEAGRIDYVCTPHHMMFGTIVVHPAPAGPKPAGPPRTLSSVSPVAMAGLGTGWLVVIGLLTFAQVRARVSYRTKKAPVAEETS
jgi:plastocyanin